MSACAPRALVLSRSLRVGRLQGQGQAESLRRRSGTLQIDEVDQQIVASLIADARSSFAEIGARVSLSAPAVKRRVDRLRSAGVIKGFTAVIDPAAAGGATEAFVELFCTGRTTPAQIAAAARKHPAVLAAFTVSGEADALVHL